MSTFLGTAPRVIAGVLVLGVTVGCAPEDQRTETLDTERAEQRREAFPEEGLAELDAGNEAYGADDFEAALEHYRKATELMPTNAASWFGIAMAATALGMPEVADSAMTEARELAPGATLIHPDDPGGGSQ